MHNKQRRKNDQRNNKTRIPSWRREAGRGKENCHQISTGAHPGNAAGTPSLLNICSEVHRNRIPGPSKSSFKRSSSRLCLELNMLAPSRGLATSLPHQATSYKPQAASVKLQALEFFVDSFKRQATSVKLQATSGKLQAARAFIKFYRLVSFRRN